MSTNKSQIEINILQRVKEAYKLSTDTELAEFLGVNQSTIANWKKRDSMNIELIITKCNKLNMNWLLFGEGPMWKSEISGKDDQANLSGLADSFEQKAVDLIQRVENGPWRVETKLQIIESMMRIVQKELKDLKDEP